MQEGKETSKDFLNGKVDKVITMREKIIAVVEDTNPEVSKYQGNDMMREGVIDSFEVIDIVTALEDEFDIEIDASLVVADNFRNMDSIVEMMEGILG